MASIGGTQGYADEVESLFRRYESISFAKAHASVLHLIPSAPCRVLDIGAGTGRDAAALAAMGHTIVAVEPTDAMRLRAMALHPSPRIEWLDDGLPELAQLVGRRDPFDLVMLTAVWMHLDEPQRCRAMARVAALVRRGGVMSITLRHGPVPRGRRMFEVSANETIGLAEAEGLRLLLNLEQSPALTTPNVSWTRLAFARLDETA